MTEELKILVDNCNAATDAVKVARRIKYTDWSKKDNPTLFTNLEKIEGKKKLKKCEALYEDSFYTLFNYLNLDYEVLEDAFAVPF